VNALPGPLSGRTVLITRAREQAGSFANLLSEQGAQVYRIPTIRFEEPDSWEVLDGALDRLSSYGLVIFTSVNGIRGFWSRSEKKGADLAGLHKTPLAAIGSQTAEVLEKKGHRVEVLPKKFVAEGLFEALRERNLSGVRVLIPRAQEARDVLVTELEKRGAAVTVAPVYRTVPATENRPQLVRLFEQKKLDLVTFTAASTVTNLANLLDPEQFPSLLRGAKIACIGRITAEAVARYGLTVDIIPSRYTIADLSRSIAKYYSNS